MIKKNLIVFLLLLLLYIKPAPTIATPGQSAYLPQTATQLETKIGKKFHLFLGMGFYSPSLTEWNQAVMDVNAEIAVTGTDDFQSFQRVKDGELIDIAQEVGVLTGYTLQSGSVNTPEANSIYQFGIKYYVTPSLNLSLSFAHYKSEASTRYFAQAQGVESAWPNYGYEMTDYLTVGQEIEIYPALLSLTYALPFSVLNDHIDFYVGGGAGFYFSKLKTELSRDFTLDYSKGHASWDSMSITPNPLYNDIISNITAKANPLGYHVSAGVNLIFGIVNINFEVGYHFVQTNLKSEDWAFFSRKYTHVVDFNAKNYNATSETYNTIYKETRKYFFEVPETAYDKLKIKKLDFSGIMIKGSMGLIF